MSTVSWRGDSGRLQPKTLGPPLGLCWAQATLTFHWGSYGKNGRIALEFLHIPHILDVLSCDVGLDRSEIEHSRSF